MAGRYNRDLSQYELEKSKKDTFVNVVDDCIIKALDFLLKFKEQERKITKKNVEFNLQLHAHNCSSLDTWILLNNFPCHKHFVDFIKIGKGIASLGVFNGYKQNNKKNSSISLF